ncbi:hypothetical protein C5167_041603 [Papaver somniferum]|nr:hypothetical protein C5167_041603 [Papaver somniferum]
MDSLIKSLSLIDLITTITLLIIPLKLLEEENETDFILLLMIQFTSTMISPLKTKFSSSISVLLIQFWLLLFRNDEIMLKKLSGRM